MLTKLPSGRWQARVWVDGRKVAITRILDDRELRERGAVRGTFKTREQARLARSAAELKVAEGLRSDLTVKEFWDRWTTDPLFERPKKSTNLHRAERTKAFAKAFADTPIARITDDHVGQWLRGGQRNGTVPALRAMFNDARSARAGRLVTTNPFSGLGISRGPGNRYVDPPSPEQLERIIREARVVLPSFGDWIEVGAATGLRSAELDALRWENVDLDAGRIRVVEQYSQKAARFELPKNGKKRVALVTPPAAKALRRMERERRGEFVFEPPYAAHFTQGNRDYYWPKVRKRAGVSFRLYVATRHYFGWYAVNVLRLESEDVAILMGHEDGGTQVRMTYGHRDHDLALERALQAFEHVEYLRPRAVGE